VSHETNTLPAGVPLDGGLSVVLPAYNEEANITRQVEMVLGVVGALVDELEVVVVNDGSRDGTAAAVTALAQRHPNVRLVSHPTNLGYGAALYSGFTSAGRPWIFMTDADCQFDLSELRTFLPFAASHDLVIGYRKPRRDPTHRRLFGWGWSLLARLLLGSPAKDVDCAFKLFRREVIEHITIRSRGATFSAEFIARAKRAGYRFKQLPVTHLPRQAGSPTGGRLDVILRAFRELVAVRTQLWRE
jgi:glycosyltransferase involved in cell wall biosynthesis